MMRLFRKKSEDREKPEKIRVESSSEKNISSIPSISILQKEIQALSPKQISSILIRLAKHKKENKELLSYLLFESDDQESFIEKVKLQMEEALSDMNKSNLYFSKKTIRKVLRIVNKNSRFSGLPVTEIELRIYFCRLIVDSGIQFRKSKVLENLYVNQINKIRQTLNKLHEDQQADYMSVVDELEFSG